MSINPNITLSLKYMLIFIPIAFISYLFHELGHWIIGEILGNNMAFSLNNVWPENGNYINPSDELFMLIGGPLFTILLSLVCLFLIEKSKNYYLYPIVFFQFFFRSFSLFFGGFEKQDEAIISSILRLGKYTIAMIVVVLLFLIVLRTNHLLRITLKNNLYFLTMSTIGALLVIKTYQVLLNVSW